MSFLRYDETNRQAPESNRGPSDSTISGWARVTLRPASDCTELQPPTTTPSQPSGSSDPGEGGERPSGEPSFPSLYEEVAPALYAWASLRLRPGLRGRIDPEDVLQEVWVRAIEAEPRRRELGTAFRPWVFGMAKNVLLEALRKTELGRGEGWGNPSSHLALVDQLPDQATAITRRVAKDENMRLFLERARELADDDRMILLHHGFEGLAHADVATRLGLPRDTVAKRWQRLRSRLLEEPTLRGLLG